MGFKELQTLDADNVIALGGKNKKTGKSNPSSVEGYYLGNRKVDSKKSKNGFAYIHFFQTPKGNVGVWGKTDLDRKLLGVEPGTMVRATFAGMKPTPNGDMYTYKVEQDTDERIEVDLASNNTESESTSEEEGRGEEEEAEEEQEEETPPAMSASSRASRRDEVKNLIGKRK